MKSSYENYMHDQLQDQYIEETSSQKKQAQNLQYNQRSVIYSFFTVLEIAWIYSRLSKRDRFLIFKNEVIGLNSRLKLEKGSNISKVVEIRKTDGTCMQKLDFSFPKTILSMT